MIRVKSVNGNGKHVASLEFQRRDIFIYMTASVSECEQENHWSNPLVLQIL